MKLFCPCFRANWRINHHSPLKTRSSTIAGLSIFTPKGDLLFTLCFPGRPEAQGTAGHSPGANYDKLISLEIFSVWLKKKKKISFLLRKGKCKEAGKHDRREELIRRKLQTHLDECKLVLLQNFAAAAAAGSPFSCRRWLSASPTHQTWR